MIHVTGAGRLAPDADLHMRIREDFFGTSVWGGANTAPVQRYQGPEIVNAATRPTIFDNANYGGIDVAGRRLAQMTSAAGFSVRRGGGASIPLSQQFAAAGALLGILTSYPTRRYLIQVAQRVTVSTAAVWNLALTDADGGLRVGGLTRPGVGWVTDPALNAGRWTPIYRLVSAGALVTGPDTGVSTANFHLLGIRYTEGASPRIEWLLDDEPRHLIEGDANMPVAPGGGSLSPFWLPEYGWSGGSAGAIAQMGPGMYEVRNLG